jgi:hypothetical protein
MDEYKDGFLSSHKIKPTAKDVIEIKSIVDEMIGHMLASMNTEKPNLSFPL